MYRQHKLQYESLFSNQVFDNRYYRHNSNFTQDWIGTFISDYVFIVILLSLLITIEKVRPTYKTNGSQLQHMRGEVTFFALSSRV
jgi:hypothetical protein